MLLKKWFIFKYALFCFSHQFASSVKEGVAFHRRLNCVQPCGLVTRCCKISQGQFTLRQNMQVEMTSRTNHLVQDQQMSCSRRQWTVTLTHPLVCGFCPWRGRTHGNNSFYWSSIPLEVQVETIPKPVVTQALLETLNARQWTQLLAWRYKAPWLPPPESWQWWTSDRWLLQWSRCDYMPAPGRVWWWRRGPPRPAPPVARPRPADLVRDRASPSSSPTWSRAGPGRGASPGPGSDAPCVRQDGGGRAPHQTSPGTGDPRRRDAPGRRAEPPEDARVRLPAERGWERRSDRNCRRRAAKASKCTATVSSLMNSASHLTWTTTRRMRPRKAACHRCPQTSTARSGCAGPGAGEGPWPLSPVVHTVSRELLPQKLQLVLGVGPSPGEPDKIRTKDPTSRGSRDPPASAPTWLPAYLSSPRPLTLT